MAGRLWGQGYESGRAEANKAARILRSLPPRQIPGFIGKALRTHQKETPGWETKQPDYAAGFFDGFYDRAGELRDISGTPEA